ncbi:MAG: hypothetical protein DI586_07450 [Micavibrio aeruginosavorus]|uniref:Uncharacterized protein n=1 Tax=Micavibrio aeruginosavorus TaxID=349221 RepID=A0A2W5HHW4_9BACT|nr:MAG: hypothetical protein DI586_07450 [Micavibrio aeruginosavorus]
MCDFKNEAVSCKCRTAVLAAYHELIEHHEIPDRFALDAACLVYRNHHPEDTKRDARLKVESWIYAGHLN